MVKKVKKNFSKLVNRATQFITGDLSQELNNSSGIKEFKKFDGMDKLIRQSGAEGCVLLKNNGVLPITKEDNVAVFGRCQCNYFYVGYGSGGDVIPPYKINLIDGMINCNININNELANLYNLWCNDENNVPDEGFWGHWPMNYDEMVLDYETVKKASEQSNKAIFVIGRAAGEDRENELKKGSYYLTDIEKNNFKLVCSIFKKVIIIMDCGNLIDMAWTEDYADNISAILLAGQGGQESGNAVADVLCGNVNPCGKLTDTIARYYEDYPSSQNFGGKEFNNYSEDIYVGYRYFETFAKNKVLYPFGFGLSYTTFSFENLKFEVNGNKIHIEVKITNTGNVKGKEVAELYVKAPCGKLGKPSKSLIQFEKTKLLDKNESQVISFDIDKYEFSSYDDEGKTGYKSSYVLEDGEYIFFVGNSVRTENVVGTIDIQKTEVIKKLNEVCALKNSFNRLVATENNGKIVEKYDLLSLGQRDLKERILDSIPKEIGFKGNNGYKLVDVKNGKVTLDEFISQLSNEELEMLTRGSGAMNSHLGVNGNAGAYGGITDELSKYGIPPMITSDGPAGIRIRKCTSLLPCGTTLASTWNKELIFELFAKQTNELDEYNIDILLAPGMNIHRNPLCGRNFEYYSEDPVISGEIATATVKGIQSTGRSACPKHFACNNQEVRRNTNDSRVSERALREIYLKGFEIVVKKAKPMNIMTSYNKMNGVWSHYNFDLAKTVLRDEWNYDGVVITDWWMKKSNSQEFENLKDNAYRVRSCVDVLMPGNMSKLKSKYENNTTLLETINEPNGITRAEIERSAKTVLNFILKRM